MANRRYADRHNMWRLSPAGKSGAEECVLSKMKRDRKMCRLYELRQRFMREQLNKKDGDYPI